MTTAGEPLVVRTTDYHTAGEPFRIVTGGVEPPAGGTMLAKRRDAAARLDHIRQLLVNEPRGHADMYGCFVTEPVASGSDLGVVFFHNAGYSTACGHGTIALATWAVETGRIPVREPETRFTIDVPSGSLPVVVAVERGRVTGVRFWNVPAFVLLRGLAPLRDRREIIADVAYGGAFYASVAVELAGLAIEPAALPRLIELGRELKRAIETEQEIVHPDEPELRGVYGVIFFQDEGREPLRQRNVAVFADGEVDRSPCGSGTSARLALLHADGELAVGEPFHHLSVVGSEFLGRVVEQTTVAGMPAVVTEIAGSAHRTGEHRFVLEPDDALGAGFLLR